MGWTGEPSLTDEIGEYCNIDTTTMEDKNGKFIIVSQKLYPDDYKDLASSSLYFSNNCYTSKDIVLIDMTDENDFKEHLQYITIIEDK